MLGFDFGFGKKKTSGSQEAWEDYSRQAPAWQLPYMQGGLSAAQNLLGAGAYQGPYATGYNPTLQAGQANLMDVYGTRAPQVAGGFEATGGRLSPGTGSAYDFYSGLMQDPSRYFDPSQISTMLDPNVIASAINNPVINEQIAAGTADIQNIYDRNLADVKAGAAAGGGTGSSWRALLQGDALESAGRAVGNLSSNLRGNAYGMGVGAAMAGNQALNQNLMAGRGAGIDAAGRMANLGMYGDEMTQRGYGLREGAGQGIYGLGANQRMIEEDLRAGAERGFYAPWDVLNQYWNIVGKPLGEEGTSKGGSKYKGKTSEFRLGFGGQGG